MGIVLGSYKVLVIQNIWFLQSHLAENALVQAAEKLVLFIMGSTYVQSDYNIVF